MCSTSLGQLSDHYCAQSSVALNVLHFSPFLSLDSLRSALVQNELCHVMLLIKNSKICMYLHMHMTVWSVTAAKRNLDIHVSGKCSLIHLLPYILPSVVGHLHTDSSKKLKRVGLSI